MLPGSICIKAPWVKDTGFALATRTQRNEGDQRGFDRGGPIVFPTDMF